MEFSDELNFTVAVVDIDKDHALHAQYNTLVPVLTRGEKEICHYFLDKVALCEALNKSTSESTENENLV